MASRVLAILLVLLLPRAADSLALLPLVDDRVVSLSFQGQAPLVRTPATPFSDFEAFLSFVGAGDVNQTSRVGAQTLSGDGGNFDDGAGQTQGESRYDLTFRVDQPSTFAFAGQLGGWLDFVTVRLSDPSSDLVDLALSGFSPVSFSESGLLQPGIDYRLVVASGHPGGFSVGPNSWRFSFAIAVPEPRSSLLIVLCLLVLCAIRQMRGKATPATGRASVG